jgi:hypothetical protein
MRYDQDPDRTRLDPYPAAEPAGPAYNEPVRPAYNEPARPYAEPVRPYEEEVVEENAGGPSYQRIRAVNIVCTVITVITAIFAVVLGVHIVLVLGNANMTNGFASFVDGWASGIRLGLTGLFTPGNPKVATLLNEGLAALLWLAIGGLLTYLIRRFALPGPRSSRYRRVVR